MDVLLQYMQETVNKLQTDAPKDAESIVAMFDKTVPDFERAEKEKFGQLGIEYSEELERYVWTFKEFKKFQENFKAKLDLIDGTGTDLSECKERNTSGFLVNALKKENAVMCIVDRVNPLVSGSPQKLDVSSEFLKKIINANLEFVVGYRNIESVTVDEPLGQKVMAEAANLKEVNDKLKGYGYGTNFADFYNKVVEFEAYLVKDGYSRGLIEDFATAFKEEEEVKEIVFSRWVFELGGKKTGQNSSIVLQEPGQYGVLLDYKFGIENSLVPFDFDIDVQLTKEKGLADITPNGQYYAKNMFFHLPFDGELGKGSERKGYGITYSNSNDKTIGVVYNKNHVNDPLITLEDNTSGGMKDYSLNYGEDFLTTNTGAILSISKDAIQFNPSTPTRVQLTLNNRQGTGAEGIVYDLIESGGQDRSVIEKYFSNSDYKTKSWFAWKSGSKEFKDSGFSKQQAQALCNEVGLDDRHGFIQDIDGSEKKFTGIAYLPFEKSYQLRSICNQGSATVMAFGKIENMDAGHRKGIISLNSTGADGVGTIKSYIDKIKDEIVCIVPGQDSTDLAWNTEELFEKELD